MAIYLRSGLQDANEYTVAGALNQLEPRIEQIKTQYNLSRYESQFNAIYEQLNQKEKQIFEIFGLKEMDSDIASAKLEQKIINCHKNVTALSKMSGPSLWAIIGPALASKESVTDELQRQFTQYMSQAITPEFIQKKMEEDNLSISDAIAELVLEQLNTEAGPRGKVYSKKGMRGVESITGIVKSRLTKPQQELAKKFIKTAQTQQTENGNETHAPVPKDWYTIIDGQRGEQAQKMTDEQRRDIMEELLKYLASFGFDQEVLDTAREVFEVERNKKKYLTFFLGQNIINGITGLLGEIQGLYIFRALLAEEYRPKEANAANIIQWVGGLNNPHEDLDVLVKDAHLDIQIKNTTQDALSADFKQDITFAAAGTETFFKYTDILPEDQQSLAQIYQMEAFNIEFGVDQDEYVPTPNEDFAPLRQRIETLKYQADQVLALFADILLYMSTARSMEKIDSSGNILWLVGGTRLFTATQIFRKIHQELRNNSLASFHVSGSYSSGDKSTQTIVDYMNKYGSGLMRKYRDEALGSLVLTSSFTFH